MRLIIVVVVFDDSFPAGVLNESILHFLLLFQLQQITTHDCTVQKRIANDAVSYHCLADGFSTIKLLGDVYRFFDEEDPVGGKFSLSIPSDLISDHSVDLDSDDASLINVSEATKTRFFDRPFAGTSFTGTYKLLVVRLTDSGTNATPTLSATALGDSIFGSGNTLLERFNSCSKGVMGFEKMTGSGLTNGVLEATSTSALNGNDDNCASQGRDAAYAAETAGSINTAFVYLIVVCPTGVNFGDVSTMNVCRSINITTSVLGTSNRHDY